MNHIYLPYMHRYALHTYGHADNASARLLIFKSVHMETEIHNFYSSMIIHYINSTYNLFCNSCQIVYILRDVLN